MAKRKKRRLRELQEAAEELFQSFLHECLDSTLGRFTYELAVSPDRSQPHLLSIYEGPLELVGGAHDGQKAFFGYNFNVHFFLDLLDLEPPPELYFDTCPQGHAQLSVDGCWNGHWFVVVFHSQPPPDADCGLRLHEDGSVTEVPPP